MICGICAPEGYLRVMAFRLGIEPELVGDVFNDLPFGVDRKVDLIAEPGVLFQVYDEDGGVVQHCGDPAPFLLSPVSPGTQEHYG